MSNRSLVVPSRVAVRAATRYLADESNRDHFNALQREYRSRNRDKYNAQQRQRRRKAAS